MSFPDRFELLEPLGDKDVQTLRARERATGREVEAHFSSSPDLLAKLESLNVVDRGSYEGKLYVVTAPLDLDSVGAWRIKEKAPPGDFTRMFELRQAPEPVAAPAARVVEAPVAAAQPGEFTRVFKKPAATPEVGKPVGSAQPGEQGEFTRMFQKPVAEPPAPAPQEIRSAPPSRVPRGLIVAAILVICAIAVFALVRTLY